MQAHERFLETLSNLIELAERHDDHDLALSAAANAASIAILALQRSPGNRQRGRDAVAAVSRLKRIATEDPPDWARASITWAEAQLDLAHSRG